MKITITDEFFIEKSDNQNWTIRRTRINKKTGEEENSILGYYGTLKGAVKGIPEKILNQSESTKQFKNLLKKLEDLDLKYDKFGEEVSNLKFIIN